ncbi:hypothetical protein N7490_000937 [Penicillium lividum]|nr:hypothetical protein N7490_000937 [Penicillium lividum]
MDSASANLIYELMKSDTAAELDRIKRVKVTQPDLDLPDREAALKSWKREIDHFLLRPQEFVAAFERANDAEDSEPETVADGDSDDESSPASESESGADHVTNSDDEASIVSHSSSLSSLSATPSLDELDHERETLAPGYKGCVACLETLWMEDMTECPCSHFFCDICMGNFVEASLADISIFPPKCCDKPIPWPTIKPALGLELVRRFEETVAEMNKPPPQPQLICSNARCSKPIPAKQIQDHVGACPKCKHHTCTFCGEEFHAGDCRNKKDWKKLEVIAKKNEWRMCPKCKAFVERTSGCNHIR